MATRSTIAKLNDDGSITSIYCHWDGYPEGVGATLKEHYTDTDKIDQLLALGWLSVLDAEIGEKHDFDNPTEGWTLAYMRDRGETGLEANTHDSINAWLSFRGGHTSTCVHTNNRVYYGNGCEYGYLWNDSRKEWDTFDMYATRIEEGGR